MTTLSGLFDRLLSTVDDALGRAAHDHGGHGAAHPTGGPAGATPSLRRGASDGEPDPFLEGAPSLGAFEEALAYRDEFTDLARRREHRF